MAMLVNPTTINPTDVASIVFWRAVFESRGSMTQRCCHRTSNHWQLPVLVVTMVTR